jgi:hypothetical protein
MKKTLLCLFTALTFSLNFSAQIVGFECNQTNNTYIEIPTPSGSNLRLQSDYTIEFWMFVPSSAGSTIHAINTNFNNQGSTFIRLLPNSGASKVEFWVNGNSSYNTIPSTTNSFTTGVWNHFAVSYNETTGEAAIYINGLLNYSYSFTVPLGVNNQTSKICILANADNSTVTQSAIIDEVRIWSGVRSAQEIGSNYNSCMTGQEPNLLAYYDFESESGAVITDKTSNGNNGTINNINSGVNNFVASGLDCNALSITENEQLYISLFPNPTSSILTIESNDVINSIQIFNLLGELVQTEKQTAFSVEQLPKGIYLLEVQTGEGTRNIRFVKE